MSNHLKKMSMKKSIFASFAGIVILLVSGCSPVKISSDPQLSQSTGIRYYTVKPYLQVDRDVSNNSIVKATVLYLPDLEKPQYLEIKGGIGSKKVDLKLADGSVNTFGLDSDPKIAETLTALANLASKASSAVSDVVSIKSIPPAAGSSTVTELYDIIMSNGVTTVKKIEIK
jgi:hypothetical protein